MWPLYRNFWYHTCEKLLRIILEISDINEYRFSKVNKTRRRRINNNKRIDSNNKQGNNSEEASDSYGIKLDGGGSTMMGGTGLIFLSGIFT